MFTLRLLGGVSLDSPEGRITGPVLQQRRVAVLAMLVACGDQGCSRDRLIGCIWPENEKERARHNLANALYVLRNTLGEGAILASGEYLRLNFELVETDAVAFQRAVEDGHLEEAAGLYGGSFLEGFYLSEAPEFERWVESERKRLFDACTRVLEELAEEAEAAGDGRRAVDWWRRANLHDPYNSRYALRLMQALAAAGDRGNALQFAQEHERRLSEELGIEPDAELLALAERLRRDSGQEDQPFRKTVPTATGAETRASEAPPRRGLSWPKGLGIRTLAVAAAVALVAGLTWYVGWGRVASETGRPSGGTRVVERNAIAVLPFENLSGDPEDEYFTAGIHDEIITRLAGIGALRVISRGSVMEFKDRSASPRVVAERLGVDFILEGGVRRSGDRVRIAAQLIDAHTDDLLWGQTYDRGLSDIFAVQSDVANQIARALRATLTPVEQARITRKPTESIEAHNAYLLGRFHWNKRTEESLRTAIEYFKQAIEDDPQYALPYSGLADSYILLETYGRNRSDDAIRAARGAALRALDIDSLLAEAHSSLAWIKLEFDWDFVGAGRRFERAIELNPSYATAHHWYAVYLRAMGRLDESLTHWRKAEELDPLSVIITAEVGTPLADKGDYHQAIDQYHKALALDPDFALAHSWLGLTYAYQGMFDEAIHECQRAVELSGRLRLYVENLAYAYAAAGESAAARSLLEELEAKGLGSPVEVYAKLGELDLAFQLLEREYQKHRFPVISAKSDPRFAELRADPRFSAFLKEVGLE